MENMGHMFQNSLLTPTSKYWSTSDHTSKQLDNQVFKRRIVSIFILFIVFSYLTVCLSVKNSVLNSVYWLLQIKQDYVYIVTVNSSIQPRDCRAVLGVSTGERESPGCRDQATHMWEAHIRRTVIRM